LDALRKETVYEFEASGERIGVLSWWGNY